MTPNESLINPLIRIISELFEFGESKKADALLQNWRFLEFLVLDTNGGLANLKEDLGRSNSPKSRQILEAVNQASHILSESPEQLLFQLDLRLGKKYGKVAQASYSLEQNSRKTLALLARPNTGMGKELLRTYETGWDGAATLRGNQIGTFGTNEVLLFEQISTNKFLVVGRGDNELLCLSVDKETESDELIEEVSKRRLLSAGYKITAATRRSETELLIAWEEGYLSEEEETCYFIGVTDVGAGKVRRLSQVEAVVTSLAVDREAGQLFIGMLGSIELRDMISFELLKKRKLARSDELFPVREVHILPKISTILVDAITELLLIQTDSLETKWSLNYWECSQQHLPDDLPFSVQFEKIVFVNEHEFIATDYKWIWRIDSETANVSFRSKIDLGAPTCLAGRLLVFIDKAICNVVNIDDMSIAATFESPTGKFESVRHLSNRDQLISIHSDGNFRLWDLSALLNYETPNSSDNTIVNNRGVATAAWLDGVISYDDTGNVFKIDRDGQIGSLQARLGSEITCLKLHPKQSLVATGAKDGTFFVWDPQTMNASVRTSFDSGQVSDCFFVEDSHMVLTATAQGIWALSLAPQKNKNRYCYCDLSTTGCNWIIRELPDSQHVLCVSDEGQFAIVDFRSMKLIAHWGGAFRSGNHHPSIIYSGPKSHAFAAVGKFIHCIDFANNETKFLTPYGIGSPAHSVNYIQKENIILIDGVKSIECADQCLTDSKSWIPSNFVDKASEFRVTEISLFEDLVVGVNGKDVFLLDISGRRQFRKITLDSQVRDVKISPQLDRLYVVDEQGELIVFELINQSSSDFCADRLLIWNAKLYCNCSVCSPEFNKFGFGWNSAKNLGRGASTYICIHCKGAITPASPFVNTSLTEKSWFKVHTRNAYFDDNTCKTCGRACSQLFEIGNNFFLCHDCIEEFKQDDDKTFEGPLYRACQCCGSTAAKSDGTKFHDFKFQAICQLCGERIAEQLQRKSVVKFDRFAKRVDEVGQRDKRRSQYWTIGGVWARLFKPSNRGNTENHHFDRRLIKEFRRGKSGANDVMFNLLLDEGAVETLRLALKRRILLHPADFEGAERGERLKDFRDLRLIVFTLMSQVPPAQIDEYACLLTSNERIPGAFHKFAKIVSDYPYNWYRRAEVAYHRALELAPDNAIIMIDFAKFLSEKIIRPVEAKQYFNAAMKIDQTEDVKIETAKFFLHCWPDRDEHPKYEKLLLEMAAKRPFYVVRELFKHTETIAKGGDIKYAIDILTKLQCKIGLDPYWQARIEKVVQKIKVENE